MLRHGASSPAAFESNGAPEGSWECMRATLAARAGFGMRATSSMVEATTGSVVDSQLAALAALASQSKLEPMVRTFWKMMPAGFMALQIAWRLGMEVGYFDSLVSP